MMRRIGWAAIVLMWVVWPVYAHANLLTSTPAAGSTLPTAPAVVTLSFSEPVEAAFVRVRVFDSTGAALSLDRPMVQADAPTVVTQLLPDTLPDGLYTVSWRVVSAADGHATEGAFAFGVGAVMVDGAGTLSAAAPAVNPLNVVIRWLNLAALAVLMGSVGFVRWVSPTLSRRWVWTGWAAVGLTGLLMLWMQAGVVSGSEDVLDAARYQAIGPLLTDSAFGRAWMLRGVALLLLAIPLRAGRWNIAGVALIAMAYAQALTSHAAAQTTRPEAVFLDALHVLAMGAWIGGLAAFAVMLARPTPVDSAAHWTSRFSSVGVGSVLILAFTGIYSALLHVGTPQALTETAYGLALVAKNVLLAAMLTLAAVNLLLTSRMLWRGQQAWVKVLRALVLMELSLGVGVLACSAWMTSDMPAVDAYALRQASAQSTAFFEMQTVDDQMIHLDIVPAHVGENRFTLTLYNPDGTPLEDATRVTLRFTHLDGLVGESALQAVPTGPGIYQAEGANLSVPGVWRVRLSVRQLGRFDLVTDFEVEVR
jgi:copper transport protein